MIRSLTVKNPRLPDSESSLIMELENPYKSGFFVAGITGLGPPKADINTTRRAGSDGSVYNSAKVESRNIVITLIYMGSDIEALRHKTYKYFPIKKEVELRIDTDRRSSLIKGYVESNEVGLFTNMEGSQISIVCNDPWFIGGDGNSGIQTLSNVTALFQFPFGFLQDSNVIRNGKIEFSSRRKGVITSIQYNGDVDTGVTMIITCLTAPGNISIANATSGESMSISSSAVQNITGTQLSAGDEITITTYTGRKTVTLRRGGTSRNIIAAVDRNSKWITIYSGENNLSVTGSSGQLKVSMDVDVLYEGV